MNLIYLSVISVLFFHSVCGSSTWTIPSALTKKTSRDSSHEEIVTTTASFDRFLQYRGGSSGSDDISKLDWRYFLAGGICAATSHGITTPIDVIKTKIQTNPEKYKKGLLHAARTIIAEEGAAFLLAGLGPTVVGYGLEGALKFGFYETFKGLLGHLTPSIFFNFLLASVVAGAVASVVLCPMEETRIKMVGEASWSKESLVSGIVRLVRESGLLATFGGLPAMLSKQVPYTMGKQVSFDIFAGMLYGHFGQRQKFSLNFFNKVYPFDVNTKWPISITSAFLASIVACISSQPGDVILTDTYGNPSGQSFSRIVGNIYKSRGLKGFYVGLEARIAHVASIITSQLVLYDIVKLALGLPVTGSH